MSHIPFTGGAPGGPEEAAFIAGSGEAPEYSLSLHTPTPQYFAPFKYQLVNGNIYPVADQHNTEHIPTP